MRFINFALSLTFAQSVCGYARSCKRHTEPCIGLRCLTSRPIHYYPYNLLYGCCKGNVYDLKNYNCVFERGVISLISCNPCIQFRCANGQCVQGSWRCDGLKNCRDGTDEVGCLSCRSDQFRCTSGRCISQHRVCDKYNDCGDGSDETNCVSQSGLWCGSEQYRCKNEYCIPRASVCNYINNCGDGSDEENCPLIGKKRDEILEPGKKGNDETGKVRCWRKFCPLGSSNTHWLWILIFA